ncbi:MAG: hypothetical protein ACI4MI_05110 [Christensenellales bacterium]
MFINKKLIVLSGESGGYVKLENLGDKTLAKAKINGCKDAVLAIFEGKNLVWMGDCESIGSLNIDNGAPITVVALSDGRIISKGYSNGASLGQSYITGEINRAVGNQQKSQKVDTYNQKSQEKQRREEVVEREEKVSDGDRQEQKQIDVDDSVVKEQAQDKPDTEQEQQRKSKSATEKKEQAKQDEKADMPHDEDIQEKQRDNTKAEPEFYLSIKEELDKLFSTYEADEELSALIDDSKWVRVPTGDNGYYVTGIVYYDDVPQIICYGVPDKDNTNPPPCNDACRQWLQVADDGRGYWMMYQSATDGEFVQENR